PQYFVGGVLDVTERKWAEDALSSVNRRLIEAQEQERRRIARELHDDINQRLSLLTVEIEQLRAGVPASDTQAGARLSAISERVVEITSDIQTLSHQLHSSKLEYLGVVAAIESFCREYAEQQGLKIEFAHAQRLANVPYEISLCLFRILQEALHNGVKHS